MFCQYCLQSIPDRSQRCSECGSRLTDEVGDTRQNNMAMPGAQTIMIGAAAILLLPILLCMGLAVIRPGLLPRPVVALFNPQTPVPTPLPQITRAAFALATPVAWQEHTNPQAGFTVSFPANWLVVNQAQSGWQSRVEDLTEEYSWAAGLFESGVNPADRRTRAIDPGVSDLSGGKVMLFTAGTADSLGRSVTFSDIQALASNEPVKLAELAGSQAAATFSNQRTSQLTLNGQPALLVEFISQSRILNQPIRGVTRLYFIQSGSKLYAVGYFAEEQLANSYRSLYEDVARTFRVNE
jgi:hypothetical protein